jgi:uncharacterized protein (TIGR02147 family)
MECLRREAAMGGATNVPGKNINIFAYLDFRLFLRDKCAAIKESFPGFSYRLLSKRAEIHSSGFLSSVIAGKKSISGVNAIKLANALKLNTNEKEYFLSLVNLANAKDPEQRQTALKALVDLSKEYAGVDQKYISYDDYYKHWYNVVIRELVAVKKIGDDYEYLAQLLDPPITTSEARNAIDLLSKLGFVKKSEDGTYDRVERFLLAGSELTASTIRHFQKEMILHAANSVEKHSREERNISALTMSIDKPTFELISQAIESLRRTIMKLVESVEKPDGVYQLNIQCFPVSNPTHRSPII